MKSSFQNKSSFLLRSFAITALATAVSCSSDPGESSNYGTLPDVGFQRDTTPGPDIISGNDPNDGGFGDATSDVLTCDEEHPCTGTEICRDGICGPECDSSNSCDAPLICREGTCELECDANIPCNSPLQCINNVCEFECESAVDCGPGELCNANQCVTPECTIDLDCDSPLTQICTNYLCEDLPCGTHTFSYAGSPTATTVHVAGSFNAWAPTAAAGLEMVWSDALNLWFARTTLENGPHTYKFVIDETDWILDPGNPSQITDDEFNTNSLVDILCTDEPGGVCGDIEEFDWRDAVMYFLLVDRFYDSDNASDPVPNATGGNAASGPSGQYEGGDLAGVTAKLDYLSDLGVTALWLSAPYENRDEAGPSMNPDADSNQYSAYHGYWPSPQNTNFANMSNPTPTPEVESRVGTSADLHTLIDSTHAQIGADGQGMKILFDYVMNHVDENSPLFQAHSNDGWFVSGDNGRPVLCGPDNLWGDPYWGTRCAFTDYLPAFDFYNDDAREWSINDAIWWAQEYEVDGYRLDAIKHVPLSWLTDLRARLNSDIEDPVGDRFYLVGETFDYGDRDLLASFINTDTMLDGQFDFPLKANLCKAVFSHETPMNDLASWMEGNNSFYGADALMTTWIGNHDIPRTIHFASRQIGNCMEGSSTGNGWTSDYHQPSDGTPYERLGVVYAILMTSPGIPLIYYGDEIGLAGGGDPDNRRMMPWDDSSLNAHQIALRNRISTLARIRAENRVITRGRRATLSSDGDTWVYRMSGCEDASPDVIVAINRADSPRTVTIPSGSYTDLMINAAAEGGTTELGARGFAIYRAR